MFAEKVPRTNHKNSKFSLLDICKANLFQNKLSVTKTKKFQDKETSYAERFSGEISEKICFNIL